jgi:hypothetical protein
VAGTPAGYSALPAIALLKAWLKRASGHVVNAATHLKLICSFATSRRFREQRLPTFATSRGVVGVRFGARAVMGGSIRATTYTGRSR